MAEDPSITKIIQEVELSKTGRQKVDEDTGPDFKPFWKQSFNIGGKEVTFKQESIELRMEKADYQCFGNEGAYMQYLKRDLFPRGKVRSPIIAKITYGDNGHVISPPKPAEKSKRHKGQNKAPAQLYENTSTNFIRQREVIE